ncbi:MAG: type VI secretion system baseplate subunit TssK [Nannocystaceae bacterium]|nr:type VI secretion system baseplate subunit TssK [Myxococcales bacterium]
MKLPRRVVWSEGMFMAPQHLQQLDAYHDGALAARMAAATPYPWGVLGVEIDTAALGNGELRVLQFSGVMPDGLAVSISADEPHGPPPRVFVDRFPPTQQSLDVYLSVPRPHEGGASYGRVGEDGARARWLRVSRTMPDVTGGPSSVAVEFGVVNAMITFDDEVRGDYTSIKIAEVRRNEAGLFELDRSFIPPILRLSAAPWLVERLADLLSIVLVRQRKLAETCRQRDASAVEFASADVTRYLLLGAINEAAPVLQHMVEAATVSAHDAYLQLARLLGQLGTFSADAMVASVPKFVYGDLRQTFAGLIKQVSALVSSLSIDTTIRVAMRRGDDGFYAANLTDERLLGTSAYFLAIRSEVPEEQLIEQVPRLGKVAARSEITQFVQVALPGVPLSIVYRPPSQIAVRSGVTYFALDTAHAAWRNIMFERALALYLPGALAKDSTQIELLAIPGQ